MLVSRSLGIAPRVLGLVVVVMRVVSLVEIIRVVEVVNLVLVVKVVEMVRVVLSLKLVKGHPKKNNKL